MDDIDKNNAIFLTAVTPAPTTTITTSTTQIDSSCCHHRRCRRNNENKSTTSKDEQEQEDDDELLEQVEKEEEKKLCIHENQNLFKKSNKFDEKNTISNIKCNNKNLKKDNNYCQCQELISFSDDDSLDNIIDVEVEGVVNNEEIEKTDITPENAKKFYDITNNTPSSNSSSSINNIAVSGTQTNSSIIMNNNNTNDINKINNDKIMSNIGKFYFLEDQHQHQQQQQQQKHHPHNNSSSKTSNNNSSSSSSSSRITPATIRRRTDDDEKGVAHQQPLTISPPPAPGTEPTADDNNLILKIIENDEKIDAQSFPQTPLPSPMSSQLLLQQNAIAFTIELNGSIDTNSSCSNNAVGGSNNTSAKYNKMLERFQNRHRRGSSVSKLSDNDNNVKNQETEQMVAVNDNNNSFVDNDLITMNRKTRRDSATQAELVSKVKLRAKDRSLSAVRDAKNRHSWSPRSSTHESQLHLDNLLKATNKQKPSNEPSQSSIKKMPSNELKKKLNKDKDNLPKRQNELKSDFDRNLLIQKERILTKKRTNTEFTPRSTAMQLALEKIDFLGCQPPLDEFKQAGLKAYGSEDEISEAGTYTLDGDNYTEEEKQLMNIDKFQQKSDKNSKFLNSTLEQRNNNNENFRKNVLQVENIHSSSSSVCGGGKISYLEQIKAKVKNINSVSNESSAISSILDAEKCDRGSFTSVTTCGVLAKKPSLDKNPKITRKTNLTTSQIDNSDYFGGNQLNKSMGTKNYTTYTDNEKTVSRVNQTDAQILNELDNLDDNSSHNSITKLSDSNSLKMAQTKLDWIQEWARNARARSVTTNIQPGEGLINSSLTRSCNLGNSRDESNRFMVENNGGQIYKNKPIEKFKQHVIGSCEYSSDPNVSQYYIPGRPPVSPSKIPSPTHLIGRARSNTITTKMRGSLQDLSPSDRSAIDTDFYLNKTATAITNYKNSMRNMVVNPMNSPEKTNNIKYYSADEFSPPSNLHKRNLSLDYNKKHQRYSPDLMTQSFNTNNREFSRSENFRPRKNSFDSNSYKYYQYQNKSPAKYNNKDNIMEQNRLSMNVVTSPLRRSTSFSTKTSSNQNFTTAMKKSNFMCNNMNNQSAVAGTNVLQKSASSTSFKKVYNDYDDNAQYYINDQDDLEYYSSDEFEEPNEMYSGEQINRTTDGSYKNTRYNKALLMRIELSKQKVSGNNIINSKINTIKPGPGVIACPNTPELPRRSIQNQQQRSSMRQSVPRDSSLNRLKREIPNSLASAKTQLLQQNAATGAANKSQPRYMDISKYKPLQGNTFLKKDESKMTLKNDIKRSPSSASVVPFNRTDLVRSSSRSVKSAGGNTGSTRPVSGSAKRDSSASRQKEVELAMWRRRATYDPMKAAAEDKRRKEEARKNTQMKNTESSSIVLRSQSFHHGVSEMVRMKELPFLNKRNSFIQQQTEFETESECGNEDLLEY